MQSLRRQGEDYGYPCEIAHRRPRLAALPLMHSLTSVFPYSYLQVARPKAGLLHFNPGVGADRGHEGLNRHVVRVFNRIAKIPIGANGSSRGTNDRSYLRQHQQAGR